MTRSLKRKLQEGLPDDGSSSAAGPAVRPSGVRRRMVDNVRSHCDAHSSTQGDLPLNRMLKMRWAKGQLSSAAVQDIAHSAMDQGASGCDAFARIGAAGHQPGNMFRDLCAAIGTPIGAPAITWIRMPLETGKKMFPIVMPHLLFEQFLKERP
eukprot:289829-Pyramimonas_sp.AAC.1